MRYFRSYSAILTIGVVFGATGCASSGAGPATTSSPRPSGEETVIIPQSRTIAWPIKTREHVDLWLHCFALLQDDSTLVPYFKRGYREAMTVAKNKANVFTQLDANIERLGTQIRESRNLVSAQFVPLYFSSATEMEETINRFLVAGGNPNAARTREDAAAFSILATYFPTPSDRGFLSLFASSMWDEETQFYHSYWMQRQRERANVIDSVEAMWQNNIRPRMQRILNNTQQRNGDILLSLPLGGEGRTLSSSGNTRTTVAVTFPERPADVPEAIYVMIHELVGTIANGAVNDNITPAEQRNGVADKLSSTAAVRGGLIAMEKIFPELADGYARFYLRAAGRTPHANPRAELVAVFPLQSPILDAMSRQLEAVQSGI